MKDTLKHVGQGLKNLLDEPGETRDMYDRYFDGTDARLIAERKADHEPWPGSTTEE